MALTLPLNDIPSPYFLNSNYEDEFHLFIKDAYAEELQLREALEASLFTSNELPVRVRGESSRVPCELCLERKENHQLLKNGNCGHSFCLDCIGYHVEYIKKEIRNVACPAFNCGCALKFDAFEELPSKDMNMQWEKPLSLKLTPTFSCSKNLYAKTVSENVKQKIPKRKPAEATTRYILKQSYANYVKNKPSLAIADEVEIIEQDFDALIDTNNSDELPDTDDYDSDASPRSPRTWLKKSKWFKKFVKELEYLSNEGEMNNPNRQWYCPACQGGACAIRRYLGLPRLIKHARKQVSNKAGLHRELAQLLEEKLWSPVICKGRKEGEKDHDIVWPPMVVLANACLQKYENEWINIPNEQLMDMFSSSYDCIVEARESDDYPGPSGASMLIFESSARGYLEAVRLHKYFEQEGTGRDAWSRLSMRWLPIKDHGLFGYLAMKEDVDYFNDYPSHPNLKYEMRSYQEMVVKRIKQMDEENQQVDLLKKRVAELQKQAKEFEECNSKLKEKLRIANKEMDIVRSKMVQHDHQKNEELEFEEQFYKQQIRNILESRNGDLDKQQENVEEYRIENPAQRYDYAVHTEQETAKPIKKQKKKKKKQRAKDAESRDYEGPLTQS